MRIREVIIMLRRLPTRLALKVVTAGTQGRIQLAELLEPAPGYIGPVAKLSTRTLVACGDHYLWVLNGDRGVGHGVLKKGSWQRDDFDAALGLLTAKRGRLGGVFLDVGANIGTQSVYAALSGQFEGIVAIEPEPRNAAVLRDNLSLNDLAVRFELVRKAVGRRKGVSHLSLHEEDSGMHSLTRKDDRNSVAVEVDTVPSILVDLQIPPEEISFIWMDIERGEFDVFPTIPDLLARRTPVFFEYGRFAVTDEQYDHWAAEFARYGYECYIVDRGAVSGPMTSADALSIEFGNLLLI